MLSGEIYHLFNHANGKENIFIEPRNYTFFLKKLAEHILPVCKLFSYCLMPNHFHFLIHANNNTEKIIKETPLKINALTEGIRLLLSSYTQGINKQNNSIGNLFQQKTKFKCITDGDTNYGYTTFQYTHQNPLKAKLVTKLEDWEFSSFADYAGLRNGNLCNKELAALLFGLNTEKFLIDSYKELPDDLLRKIF